MYIAYICYCLYFVIFFDFNHLQKLRKGLLGRNESSLFFHLKPQCLCINFHGFVPMKPYYKHKAKILVTTYTRHLDTCLSHPFQRAILFTMGLRCVRTVAPASCWVYVRHARTCPLGHRADVATLYLWPRFLLLGSSKRFPAKGCQVTSHIGQHGPQQHLSS